MDNQHRLEDECGQIGQQKKLDVADQHVGETSGLARQHCAGADPQKPRAEEDAHADVIAFEGGDELAEE